MKNAEDGRRESKTSVPEQLLISVPAFATSSRQVEAIRRVNGARRRAWSRHLQYRLAVLGTGMADVVRNTGGLMFDHVMAGWDVTVLVPDCADPRPLRILGTPVLDLHSALALDLDGALLSRDHSPWPHVVAISGALYASDTRCREGVLETLNRREVDVLVWGNAESVPLDRLTDPAHHKLSRAARVFKAHALTAASEVETDVECTESFRRRCAGADVLHFA